MKKAKKVLVRANYSKVAEETTAKFVPLKNSQTYIGYYHIPAKRLKQLEDSLCYAGDDYLVLPEGFNLTTDGSAVEYVCPDEDS